MIEVITKPALVQAFPDLGKYCTYKQAVHSETAEKLGLKNVPTEADFKRMQHVYDHAIVPIFNEFGPGVINSFFRSNAPQLIPGTKRYTNVNAAVGGDPESNHLRGMAVDLDYDSIKGVTNIQVFDWVRLNIPFYELISEVPHPINNNPQWVHVATNVDFPNRKRIKRMIYNKAGKKEYQQWPWLWSPLKK